MLKKIFFSFLVCLIFVSSANACESSGLRTFNKELDGKKTCILEGTYIGTLTLDGSYSYLLLGAVYIGNEKRDPADLSLKEPVSTGRLVVNAGVRIYALNPSKDKTGLWDGFTKSQESGEMVSGNMKSYISVARDSQIEMRGNEVAPILMTSAQGAHQVISSFPKKPGDWGGLVINGKAKSNKCVSGFMDCTLPGEAGTGWYGGSEDTHSSGSIQFLQVEYGGDRINGEKELNGITFNTVGLGTLIHNIAVLYNADDCIEFFGGAATVTNIFCYKGEDDGVDSTDGARVFLQNGIVVAADFQGAGEVNDRHMVEADSSKNDNGNLRLRSHPVLTNFTFVGGLNSQGFMLRLGTDYKILNSVVIGIDSWCLNVETANILKIQSNIFAGCQSTDPIFSIQDNDFLNSEDLKVSGFVPKNGSPLLAGAELIEEFYGEDLEIDEAFYDVYGEMGYRGAMGANNWTTWIQTRD